MRSISTGRYRSASWREVRSQECAWGTARAYFMGRAVAQAVDAGFCGFAGYSCSLMYFRVLLSSEGFWIDWVACVSSPQVHGFVCVCFADRSGPEWWPCRKSQSSVTEEGMRSVYAVDHLFCYAYLSCRAGNFCLLGQDDLQELAPSFCFPFRMLCARLCDLY